MLLYHHCIPLEKVVFDTIVSSPEQSDPDLVGAFRWLEKEVGFYPLFLAVGDKEMDIRMTGYQRQWSRVSAYTSQGVEYVKKGAFYNEVLFSFENLDGVFTDYDAWCMYALPTPYRYVSPYNIRQIFKRSWSRSRWLRKALDNPCTVQLVSPSLDLRTAGRIWVRNKKTKKRLERIGFDNVTVHRVLQYSKEV